MYACELGHYEIVQELLNNGAEIDFIDYPTPIMIASQYGHLQIVQELLNRGANIDASLPLPFGGTALERASTKRRIAIVKELITRGANVDINYGHILEFTNQPIREILQKYYLNQ
jgi:ankyrin repeat protein